VFDSKRGQTGQFKEKQISITAVVFGCSNKRAAVYISNFVFNTCSDAVPSSKYLFFMEEIFRPDQLTSDAASLL